MSGLDELRELIVTLRGEGGCPWDKRQTLRSLAPYLVEEAREALEALESGSDEDSAEEIGDVLLIIML
ncbi:MAG TPA: MazG nucleotide pyrophosphohydrolase domain-containing protein, partial [bacterium]|nr:MazG nucleotide pyrophosphohydrolase domain-containing protein [bacterium]